MFSLFLVVGFQQLESELVSVCPCFFLPSTGLRMRRPSTCWAPARRCPTRSRPNRLGRAQTSETGSLAQKREKVNDGWWSYQSVIHSKYDKTNVGWVVGPLWIYIFIFFSELKSSTDSVTTMGHVQEIAEETEKQIDEARLGHWTWKLSKFVILRLRWFCWAYFCMGTFSRWSNMGCLMMCLKTATDVVNFFAIPRSPGIKNTFCGWNMEKQPMLTPGVCDVCGFNFYWFHPAFERMASQTLENSILPFNWSHIHFIYSKKKKTPESCQYSINRILQRLRARGLQNGNFVLLHLWLGSLSPLDPNLPAIDIPESLVRL